MALAWGKTAVHESDSSEHFGTQQCLICYTNVSKEQCVRFKPCGHEVCSLCMQELRKEAIRKVWERRFGSSTLQLPCFPVVA